MILEPPDGAFNNIVFVKSRGKYFRTAKPGLKAFGKGVQAIITEKTALKPATKAFLRKKKVKKRPKSVDKFFGYNVFLCYYLN